MKQPDRTFDDTPEWAYFVEEVFVSTYRVRAVSVQGRSIEVVGAHAEELVERLHQEVLQIIQSNF